MQLAHLVVALFSGCLWLLSGSTAGTQCIDTFEPGCKLAVEAGQAQRHCMDPTKFWWCAAQNTKAEQKKCQPNTGFDQNMNACIPWIDWVWKPCIEPPSRPTGWEIC